MSKQKDTTQTPDTGHQWDDNLRELTNQPPRWWMISFYLSLLFLVVYFILYPAFPFLTSHSKGVLGWTQIKEYKTDLAAIEKVRLPYEEKIKAMTIDELMQDSKLAQYAVRSAKVLFGERCAPCHGAGGSGNPGYPILADDDWLYGGTVDKIKQTISNGRRGAMPGFANTASESEIEDLAKYVLALSQGQEHETGKQLFFSKGCSGCHGQDGTGNQFMGAPNLTDSIWRFVPANLASVKHTISHGVNFSADKDSRQTAMPAFATRLTETEIKKLVIYVHKLGGGQ